MILYLLVYLLVGFSIGSYALYRHQYGNDAGVIFAFNLFVWPITLSVIVFLLITLPFIIWIKFLQNKDKIK